MTAGNKTKRKEILPRPKARSEWQTTPKCHSERSEESCVLIGRITCGRTKKGSLHHTLTHSRDSSSPKSSFRM